MAIFDCLIKMNPGVYLFTDGWCNNARAPKGCAAGRQRRDDEAWHPVCTENASYWQTRWGSLDLQVSQTDGTLYLDRWVRQMALSTLTGESDRWHSLPGQVSQTDGTLYLNRWVRQMALSTWTGESDRWHSLPGQVSQTGKSSEARKLSSLLLAMWVIVINFSLKKVLSRHEIFSVYCYELVVGVICNLCFMFYSWGKRPNYPYGVMYQMAPPNPSFIAQRLYGYIDMTPVIQARAHFKGEMC